jgi:hypothetical protein
MQVWKKYSERNWGKDGEANIERNRKRDKRYREGEREKEK